ncbi:hypothetical protein VCV18_009782 [Metarhizium anisopliae]|nr:hypothetical protein H633G_10501 [Metarhizium anisopliae BRIP 53284]
MVNYKFAQLSPMVVVAHGWKRDGLQCQRQVKRDPVSAGRELEQSLSNNNRLNLTNYESLLGHGLWFPGRRVVPGLHGMRLRVLVAAACKAGPEAAGPGGRVPGDVFADAA